MSEVMLNDDFFANYAKKMKADSESKANSGGYEQPDYEEISYAGLEKGIFKIVRLIGAPIGAEAMGYKRKPTDPKEVIIAEVKDDDGKRFTIRMPVPDPTDKLNNHILYRLVQKVNEKIYVNKKSVDVNATKFPELYNLVNKGGFKPEDGNVYTYTKGYKGDRLSIYNVFDKTDNWCEVNKHSKILARDVNIDDQNRVWAKPGIKSYGSVNKISEILGKDGNFEKYDIAIKKTGLKDSPWEVKNASKMKLKDMMEELSNDDGTRPNPDTIDENGAPLPEIELYDLDKTFFTTPYSRLLKRCPSVFKMTDACLGTSFFEELTAKAEAEKAEWAAKNTERETNQASAESKAIQEKVGLSTGENPALSDDAVFGSAAAPEATTETEPVLRRRSSAATASSKLSADKIAMLKGWDSLSEDIKSRIVDVTSVTDGKANIVWDRKDDLLECDACGTQSPETASHCPCCGIAF